MNKMSTSRLQALLLTELEEIEATRVIKRKSRLDIERVMTLSKRVKDFNYELHYVVSLSAYDMDSLMLLELEITALQTSINADCYQVEYKGVSLLVIVEDDKEVIELLDFYLSINNSIGKTLYTIDGIGLFAFTFLFNAFKDLYDRKPNNTAYSLVIGVLNEQNIKCETVKVLQEMQDELRSQLNKHFIGIKTHILKDETEVPYYVNTKVITKTNYETETTYNIIDESDDEVLKFIKNVKHKKTKKNEYIILIDDFDELSSKSNLDVKSRYSTSKGMFFQYSFRCFNIAFTKSNNIRIFGVYKEILDAKNKGREVSELRTIFEDKLSDCHNISKHNSKMIVKHLMTLS